MRKTIVAVVGIGIVGAVAVLAKSQLKEEAVADVDTDSTVVTMPSAAPAIEAPAAQIERVATTAQQTRTDTVRKPTRPYLRDVPNTVVEEQTTGADVLRRASQAYGNIKSLRASFVQRRENPLLSSTFTGRGTLYQKRPDRFLMKFSEPAGDIILSDGRYFWLYYPSSDAKQVLRAPAATNGAGGVDLQAQFLGDPLRRFSHTYHGTDTVNGRKTHVITMVPRENVGYKSLKVWVDTQDALVRRFVLTENNGLVQEFTLSNLTVNPTLSNDLFQFRPPANAKIIENL